MTFAYQFLKLSIDVIEIVRKCDFTLQKKDLHNDSSVTSARKSSIIRCCRDLLVSSVIRINWRCRVSVSFSLRSCSLYALDQMHHGRNWCPRTAPKQRCASDVLENLTNAISWISIISIVLKCRVVVHHPHDNIVTSTERISDLTSQLTWLGIAHMYCESDLATIWVRNSRKNHDTRYVWIKW